MTPRRATRWSRPLSRNTGRIPVAPHPIPGL
jgi:hypothetical protein